MSNKLQKQATAKATWATFSTNSYLPKLLVNVYSYHLMMKSVSCCCVHGRWIFSNPVTCMYILSNSTSSSIIPISIAYVYFVHCNLLLLLAVSLTNYELFHITLTVDNHLLIQVCTGLWLAHAWFLEIAFIHNVSM